MDWQNFAGLWGLYLMGNSFDELQCKTIHYINIKRLWGHKFVGKGGLQNPRTLIPHEQ